MIIICSVSDLYRGCSLFFFSLLLFSFADISCPVAVHHQQWHTRIKKRRRRNDKKVDQAVINSSPFMSIMDWPFSCQTMRIDRKEIISNLHWCRWWKGRHSSSSIWKNVSLHHEDLSKKQEQEKSNDALLHFFFLSRSPSDGLFTTFSPRNSHEEIKAKITRQHSRIRSIKAETCVCLRLVLAILPVSATDEFANFQIV